ncbi:MAG: uL15 family ribosomal protein [Candidatus Giovannonibacteria bacterium]|nr:MAG: uL15 family ribosomal protein [Candidatus Giovannonibacteria bacterium]
MQAHNLLKSGNKKHRRIGRGGKRGSFSGRGIKGQKSRAGRRIRPQIRDIIKKIHKRRGYRFKRGFAEKVAVVNLRDLETKFKDGEKITKELLVERGLIRSKRPVKILGSGLPRRVKAGKLIKKFIFDKDILMSRPVKEKFNVG